jgi:tRNA nucleotidyltransferase (CCA-adding enzyme)
LIILHDQVAEAHGIFRLHVPGTTECLDLACLRRDEAIVGARHAKVAFTDDIVVDLSRRDLTINAMAIPYPFDGEPRPIDPFGGQAHLRERLLKLVGPPHERLEEDPLRLLRVARFASLGEAWRVEPQTCEALRAAAPKLERISKERICQELLRAMAMPAPARFWQVVAHAQAQGSLLPLGQAPAGSDLPRAIWWLKRVAQTTDHADARLVAFFLGFMAPTEATSPSEDWRQRHGAFVLHALEQLRCAKATSSRIAQAVANFPWAPDALHGEHLARWLLATGEEGYGLMLPSLRAAGELDLGDFDPQAWLHLEARMEAMLAGKAWPTLKGLAITGQDLMARLKLPPGPHIGLLLDTLLQWATAQGCAQDGECLMQRAQNLARLMQPHGGKPETPKAT